MYQLNLFDMFTNAFNDNIKDTILLHIPHSSLHIPNKDSFLINGSELNNEIIFSTDIDTDRIFNVDGIKQYVCDFNRLFCDVERFISNEPMDKFGRGMFYTKTIANKDLREFNYSDYWNILNDYFIPYHNNLTTIVNDILIKNGSAIIVDCHSFNKYPLRYEPQTVRPDICLGVDDYHTPKYLVDYLTNHFKKHGLSVAINSPYEGTFVPTKFYKSNPNVQSIMIEVNKQTYMLNDTVTDNDSVVKLNKIITELFNF